MSPTEKPTFDTAAEDLIFRVARDQVLAVVLGSSEQKTLDVKKNLGPLADVPLLGTFVSFKKRGTLRSCMGWMSDGAPLAESLRSSAISAAKDDPRFPPIAQSELPELEMEVWVLWGMRETQETGEARLGTFEIGRHGLQIKSGYHRGLLLPAVAVEYRMSPREFLEATCRKAGLPKDAWLDANTTLCVFEGVAISRPFLDDETKKRLADLPETKKTSRESYSWNLGPLSAPRDSATKTSIRPAAVNGMFYPKGAQEQKKMLDAMFTAENKNASAPSPAAAVLIPHAGWVYSGRLAAETLARVEIPETVMIFAPKHRAEGHAWAVAPNGSWDFGAGQIAGDPELGKAFCDAVPDFKLDSAAHAREHAIEVQLPLLARLRPDVKVVGAVVGHTLLDNVKAAGEKFAAFLQTLEKPPLLIISSDMNHFENEERTRRLDQKALDALETLNPERLAETVLGNGITMCGIFPAVFVLSALKKCGRLNRFEKIGYTTSAESSGDTDRVVGYAGYLFD